MPLRDLGVFLWTYRAEVMAMSEPGSKERDLRTNFQKTLREAFHTYLFGSIFGALFGCRDIMTVLVAEETDRDALLEWTNGGRKESLRLQLKELAPRRLTNSAATPEQELQALLNELPGQYPTSRDLTIAVYLNRGHERVTVVTHPPNLDVRALWFFGWSKPGCQGLFLIGGRRFDEHRFFLPWRSAVGGLEKPNP